MSSMSEWVTDDLRRKAAEIRKQNNQRGMKLTFNEKTGKLENFRIIYGDDYFNQLKKELKECNKKDKPK